MTTNADHVELEGLLRLRYAEIDELKAEIERLKTALREIAEYSNIHTGRIARDALEGEIMSRITPITNLLGDLDTYADELDGEGCYNAANGCRAAIAEIKRLRAQAAIKTEFLAEMAGKVERLTAAMSKVLEMCDPRETRSFHIGLVIRDALEGKA